MHNICSEGTKFIQQWDGEDCCVFDVLTFAHNSPPLTLASCFSLSFVSRRIRKSSRQRLGCTCSMRTWRRLRMMRPLTCLQGVGGRGRDRRRHAAPRFQQV